MSILSTALGAPVAPIRPLFKEWSITLGHLALQVSYLQPGAFLSRQPWKIGGVSCQRQVPQDAIGAPREDPLGGRRL